MSLSCPKCAAPRIATSNPAASCPSCGIVFAKFDPEEAAELKARQEAVRRGEKVARMERQTRELPKTHSRQTGADGAAPQRQLVGFLGAAVLAIGVFMPLVSGPFGMNINYFANGRGDGVFILAMAACSAALIAVHRYRLLWATGGLSLAMLAVTFWRMQSRIAAAKDLASDGLQGNPFRGLADAAINSIQMQWGWAVLMIGAMLVLACAGMGKKQ